MFDFLKAFEEWAKLKLLLWKKESEVLFKEGDVWWCSVGVNLGEEVYGKGATFTRPVLVFKKFTSNSFPGLPLTSQRKQGSWYVDIHLHGKQQCVMLNQARVFDRKRLVKRMGVIEFKQLDSVRQSFANFYCT